MVAEAKEPDMNSAAHPSTDAVWAWLAQVEDPEIPVLSVLDLGIVRGVRWSGDADDAECVVTITPTYSGCPATEVIAQSIRDTLKAQGLARVRLETQISPAWTLRWLSAVPSPSRTIRSPLRRRW